ncbi:hypothetical protein BTJ44_01555 [Bacillus mycoides]|nr:hypothetical protein BTJ44_01555 [Bacillus mycoides]
MGVKKTPSRFWTRKKALEALKWTIEERKQMNNEEIRKKISVIWFSEIGLRTPLERYWNENPHAMLSELYPN